MLLLVSTPVHIFLVEPFSKKLSILRALDGYYYGITHRKDTLVLTHSAGYLEYFNEEAGVIQTIDHLIQPHQAEWVEDQVLVANTGRNCISVFDNCGSHCRDVYLNEIRIDDKDSGKLGNHFNSVHRSGDRIFVVAHNNFLKPSEVWELSWPELEVVDVKSTQASGAHNFWLGEWGMVIGDSDHGCLREVSSGEIIWCSNEEMVWTRGMAVSSEYIFVGRSAYFNRANRYWSTGGVWVIDRKTLRTVDKMLFPGSGDVHEIRLIGTPDECHNGEVISQDILSNFKKVSPTVALAYQLRKTFPALRRNVPPLSALVKGVQMTARWKRSIRRVLT